VGDPKLKACSVLVSLGKLKEESGFLIFACIALRQFADFLNRRALSLESCPIDVELSSFVEGLFGGKCGTLFFGWRSGG
jgi:hypothetical protein